MLFPTLLLALLVLAPVEVTADDAQLSRSPVALTVHGMGCPLCANNVDKQLLKLKAVDKVKVDLGTGVVTVTLKPGQAVLRRELAKAVDASGYTLKKVEQPAEGK